MHGIKEIHDTYFSMIDLIENKLKDTVTKWHSRDI